MITPTIHLNGTSGEALIEALGEAGQAAASLRHALQAAAPNARDYYPQGPGAFEQARAEHEARLAHVAAISHDLMLLIESVYTQLDERKR